MISIKKEIWIINNEMGDYSNGLRPQSESERTDAKISNTRIKVSVKSY